MTIEQINEADAAKYKAEALTFQRIFTLLTLLKTDFSYVVTGSPKTLRAIELQFGKKSKQYATAKEYFDAHSYGFDVMVNAIRKLDATIKSRERLQILKSELTSDRIADLHYFLDQVLEVENISILSEVLKIGLEQSKKINQENSQ
jgi:hypothetical protein